MDVLIDLFEEILKEPMIIVGEMSFDEYCDWVELGSREDLIACLKVFESKKMDVAYTSVLKFKIRQLNIK